MSKIKLPLIFFFMYFVSTFSPKNTLTFHTAMISYVHSTEMRFRPGISESIATAAPVGWNCEASWQRHQFLKPSNHPASLDDEILHFLPYHKSSIVIPS
jgi:hypothetical protein